jgi:hypothetical protein
MTLLFVAAGGRIHPIATSFEFHAFVNQQCDVAAIVHHKLRAQAFRVAHA